MKVPLLPQRIQLAQGKALISLSSAISSTELPPADSPVAEARYTRCTHKLQYPRFRSGLEVWHLYRWKNKQTDWFLCPETSCPRPVSGSRCSTLKEYSERNAQTHWR